MQVLGLAVGAAVYRSEHGCVLGFVGAVFTAFGSVTEEWLRERLAEGRTHFVTVVQGKPALQGPSQGPTYDWPDVRAIHGEVTKKIARIERRLKNLVPGGRLRGLAGAKRRSE
jgi:hypothetical protein